MPVSVTTTSISSDYKRQSFFRALGLGLLPLLGYGKSRDEHPKPVISKSRSLACGRALIHIVPCLTSITLIALNLKNLYIGRTFTGRIMSVPIDTAMLQVASKIQELLIVASLATIVAHELRRGLIGDTGIPLGTIGGAFMFSSLSYCWSPELWGSLQCKMPLMAKIKLFSLLITCALLATFAGPSTAVLIIPRNQDWVASKSDVYLHGPESTLWSSTLPNSNSQLALCSQDNATSYEICPSGGYGGMLDLAETHFRVMNLGTIQDNSTYDMLAGNIKSIMSSGFHLTPAMVFFNNHRPFSCQTGAIGMHLGETMLLDQLQRDWYNVVMSEPYNPLSSSVLEYKYYGSLQIRTETLLPSVKVACSKAQNLSATETVASFPVFPSQGCQSRQETVDIQNITHRTNSGAHISWITLPQTFGPVSTGLMFEVPLQAFDGSRLVVGCSIMAGWSNGSLFSENIDIDNRQFQSEPSTSYPWDQSSEDDVSLITDSDPSWQKIDMARDWLDLLVPSIQDNNLVGFSTTLDVILEKTGINSGLQVAGLSPVEVWNQEELGTLNRTITLENVLALLFADGLSREGGTAVLNITGPILSWSLKDYQKDLQFGTKLMNNDQALLIPNSSLPYTARTATVIITGFSFQASQATDFLAIAVLSLYLVLALGHSIIIVATCKSSGCWDSFIELFVLAQNSPTALKLLRNTGAGVKELKTYAHMAVVRATRLSHGSKTSLSRMELVFKEETADDIELQALLDVAQQNQHPRSRRSRTTSSENLVNQDLILDSVLEKVEIGALYG